MEKMGKGEEERGRHVVRQESLAFLAGGSPAHTKSNHQYVTEGRMGGGNKIHEAARREVLERNGISRECKQP
jgi:hypothetical protein